MCVFLRGEQVCEMRFLHVILTKVMVCSLEKKHVCVSGSLSGERKDCHVRGIIQLQELLPLPLGRSVLRAQR